MGKKTPDRPDQDARQKARVQRRRVGHDQQNTVRQNSHDRGGNTGRVGPTRNKTQATVSLIHLFIRLQAACRFLRSEQKNHQLDERVFLSMFGGVGNVASHLGWTGCLESGKEVGAGEATTTQVLMENRGFGVMEGAFQRYTVRQNKNTL